MLEQELKKAFGIEFKKKNADKLSGLPVYMVSGRDFYLLETEGCKFLVVHLTNNNRFGASALKKQMEKYSEATGLDIVYMFDTVTCFQRESLITHKIPFIVPKNQIFMPFLGVCLRNNLKKPKMITTEKMMPVTQSLFLYMLYKCKDSKVIKKQASEDLSLTCTSITRASEQLEKMGLITQESKGKEIFMMAADSGEDLYKKSKAYLINPVQKTICINIKDVPEGALLAGESALSCNSMLNPPSVRKYAVYKNCKEIKNLCEADPQWSEKEDIAFLELWKYDPDKFSFGTCVDIVSLAETLKDFPDERIEKAIEEYMEEYKW